MRRSILARLVVGLLLAACGGGDDDDGGAADAADTSIDAAASTCGEPGDVGNELGVGKYCAGFGDCGDTEDAPLCSSLGDLSTHFCTKTCANEDAGPTDCGTGAECTCGNGGCGCVPVTCL